MSKRTAKQAVKRAIAEVGYVETPHGSNHTKYGKAFGLDPAYWCAMFVWWVIDHDALASSPKTAYTPTLQAWAKARGILHSGTSEAHVGDIVLFQMPGPDRVNHTGIVIKDRAEGAPLYCVEGNTGGTDPRAGGMVAATKRVSNIRYIIDMREQYAPEPKKSASKAPYTLTRVLKKGSKGVAVKMLQRRLGVVVDGIFGSKTEAAVVKFQRAHKLKVDKVVGAITAKSLGWHFKVA